MSKKILVVDDDPKIGDLLSDILEENDFQVEVAPSTEDAWEKVIRLDPDLILLDVEIPLKGGFEFCREIKEKEPYQRIPIIFLTVRGQEMDKVSALTLGGDDFIVKPFQQRELLARIHVALRHSLYFQNYTARGRSGSLLIDFERRTVQINNHELQLTPKEFDLLKILYTNRHRVLTDKEIFTHVWGSHSHSLFSTVYTHLNRLRKKLKEHGEKIRTVQGTGFRFDERKARNEK